MKPYYTDEAVTLYHGDCRDVLPYVEADVLVTDPPYGTGAGSWNPNFGGDPHGNAPAMIGEPRMNRASLRTPSFEDVALRNEVLAQWAPRPALVFGSWRAPRPFATRQRLVWDKGWRGAFGGFGPWSPTDEEIYVIGDGGWDRLPRVTGTVLRFHIVPVLNRNHPTPKPVALMRTLLEWTDGVVVDSFAGSGTTLRAAKDLGRQAIGIEIEERYCEIAARRLSQEVLTL